MLIDQLQITAGKSIFDLDVAPLDPCQVAHTQAKRFNAGLRFEIVFIKSNQHTDSPYSIWLLWPHCVRPDSCRASNNFDEVSSSHLPPPRRIVAVERKLVKG